MFKSIKTYLVITGVVGTLLSGYFIKRIFEKAKERDVFEKENKVLKSDKKTMADSLQLHKELLAKAFIDAKNKSEIYEINASLLPSIQSVVKVMRDSVIKINKDRARLEAQVLELQKDLERAKKKRKFL